MAAPAPPPAASTAVAANCAEPANTSADMTIGATLPISGRASTPNETASRKPAAAYGMPTRKPRRTLSELEPCRVACDIAAGGSHLGAPAGAVAVRHRGVEPQARDHRVDVA